MSAETVDVTAEQFRAAFPEFADETTYPDATIETFIARSYMYVSQKSTSAFTDDMRILAVELMTAHLQTLSTSITSGNTQGGLVGASTVGSVTVTLVPPTVKSQFKYWINQTAYGQQYSALLGAHSPAGFYLGGSFQRVFR